MYITNIHNKCILLINDKCILLKQSKDDVLIYSFNLFHSHGAA